jgi:hypothetical protein
MLPLVIGGSDEQSSRYVAVGIAARKAAAIKRN